MLASRVKRCCPKESVGYSPEVCKFVSSLRQQVVGKSRVISVCGVVLI